MNSTPLSRRLASSSSTPINQNQYQNRNQLQQTPNSSSSPFATRSAPFTSSSGIASPASASGGLNSGLKSSLSSNSGLRNRQFGLSGSGSGNGNRSGTSTSALDRLAASAPPAHALQRLPYAEYTELIKTVLRLRLRRIYLLSFLSTHSLLCLSFFSPLSPFSSILNFISPTILFITFVTWLFSVLPLLVLRKWDIQGKFSRSDQRQPTSQESSTSLIVKPARNSALAYWQRKLSSCLDRHALAHMLSGLILALTFTLTMSYFESLGDNLESSSWSFWLLIDYQDGDQAIRPNEGVYSLILINSMLGLLYVISNSLSLSNVLPYSSAPTFTSSSTSTTLRDRFVKSASSSFIPSIALSVSSYSSLLILYSLSRWYFSETILSIVGEDSLIGFYLLPDFDEYFFSVELIIRSILLSISSGLIWKICVDALWEIYSTQPVLVSEFGKDKTRGLIGGLKARSTNKSQANGMGGDKEAFFLSNYAFAELCLLTSSSSERRKEIYQDVGISSISISGSPISSILSSNDANGRESAWKSILKECLDVLKDEIESVKFGGKVVQDENSGTTKERGLYPPTLDSRNLGPESGRKVSLSKGRNLEVTDAETLQKAVKTPKPNFWDAISASPQPLDPAAANEPTTLIEKKVNQFLPKSVTSLIGFNKASSTTAPASAAKTTPTASKSTQPQFSPFANAILAFSLTFYHLLHSDLIHVSSKILTPVFNFFYKILHSNQSLVLRSYLPNPMNSSSLIWSIESLTELSIHSLDEDRLGIVQRDLITIMEVFSDFLIAVDSRVSELTRELKEKESKRKELVEKIFPKEKDPNGNAEEKKKQDGNDAGSKALIQFREDYFDHTLELIMTLRNGLVRIGNTFGSFDLPGSSDLIREKIEKALNLPIGVEAVEA